VADLISTTRQQIEQRLAELRPLVAEVGRLERALEALSRLGDGGEAPATAPRPAPARARRGRRAALPGRRRGAPRGRRTGATRANQFLRVVRDSSGISIAEAASRLGTSPNYLYRIAAALEQEGLIERRGRTFAAIGGQDGDVSTVSDASLPAPPDALRSDSGAAEGGGQPPATFSAPAESPAPASEAAPPGVPQTAAPPQFTPIPSEPDAQGGAGAPPAPGAHPSPAGDSPESQPPPGEAASPRWPEPPPSPFERRES
jgi:hypothetical protein